MGLKGFRRARAADARTRPAWYYLSGIVPLAIARMLLNELSARAKVAREAPFDRNVEKPLVFKVQQVRASRNFRRAPMRKYCVFICFIEVRC